jgi:23S rRNA-/tRNA-specific pseudouridylate synthase
VPGDIGYFLHAYRLQLLHPHSQQLMEFVSHPPEILLTHTTCN